MVETEAWCLEQLANRELTVMELHARQPVRVCPGWEKYEEMGVLDPVTGLRGSYDIGYQTIYIALERLRLQAKVDRRGDRDAVRHGDRRRRWVYFRVAVPLSAEQIAIEKLLLATPS